MSRKEGEFRALIGDAAHPQSPFLGQGANTAIIDAFVLSRELCKSAGDVKEALKSFDKERVRINNETVRWARIYGAFFLSRNRLVQGAIRQALYFFPSSFIRQAVARHDRLHARSLVQASRKDTTQSRWWRRLILFSFLPLLVLLFVLLTIVVIVIVMIRD